MTKLSYREQLDRISEDKKKYDTWHVVDSKHKMTDRAVKKIDKWLANSTIGNYLVRYQPGKLELRYLFEKEEDAIMFTLKWV